jgi:hypothetical protein
MLLTKYLAYHNANRKFEINFWTVDAFNPLCAKEYIANDFNPRNDV